MGAAENEEGTAASSGGGGIPDFWMRSMLHSDMLKDIVQSYDIPLLKMLKDIRIISPYG